MLSEEHTMTTNPTIGQVKKLREMFADVGASMPSTVLKQFRALTPEQASKALVSLDPQIAAYALNEYEAPPGLATARHLRYLVERRRAAGNPVLIADLAGLEALTTAELRPLVSAAYRAANARNDAAGGLVSPTRQRRGFFNQELVSEAQLAPQPESQRKYVPPATAPVPSVPRPKSARSGKPTAYEIRTGSY
jgi:hypothetical protein